jgi:hypothetical protein
MAASRDWGGHHPHPTLPHQGDQGEGFLSFAFAPVVTLLAGFSPLQAAKSPPVMFSIFSPVNVSNHLILLVLSLAALVRFAAGGNFRPVFRPKTGVEVRPARRPLAEPRTHASFPAGRAGRVKVTLPGGPVQPPVYAYVVAVKRLLGERAVPIQIFSLSFPYGREKLTERLAQLAADDDQHRQIGGDGGAQFPQNGLGLGKCGRTGGGPGRKGVQAHDMLARQYARGDVGLKDKEVVNRLLDRALLP